MGHMERPRQVQEARYHDDHGALSAMGKKGAETASRNRAVREVLKEERHRELKLEKARTETTTSEGDVLPPNPEIIAFLEEQKRG